MRRWSSGCALAALLCIPVAAGASAFDITMLDATAGDPPPAVVASGGVEPDFGPYSLRDARQRGMPFWLRLTARPPARTNDASALVVTKGRHLDLQVYAAGARDGAVPHALALAVSLPEFSATQSAVFALPHALLAGDVFYARVSPSGEHGSEELRFDTSRLDRQLALGASRARMIALAFGALMAGAMASLFIWFVLRERLFLLYSALFALQGLYIAYLSGQGFDWPGLSLARPLSSRAWNVPAALSGAAASLFVREIADLRRYSHRVYRAFGWLAAVFTVVALSNFLSHDGFGGVIAAAGNVVFLGATVFMLVAALLAWRRGNRPAGWFLLAWLLLAGFTIATALQLLFASPEHAELLLYYGLPLSMVAAAILVALGVADRMREQRDALTEAERFAQTDPLTGVLNRRSLLERLDALSAYAVARGQPVALLFIDLDHFKNINDTWGHPAGDACLAAIVAPIQAELRQSDVIGRFGGEEFIVILSSADAAAAQLIAQRICERVAEIGIAGYSAPIRFTCSIGVATSDALGVWGEGLISQADTAVYAAKRAGRNRIWVAQPAAASPP